jgi:hypothetical protein
MAAVLIFFLELAAESAFANADLAFQCDDLVEHDGVWCERSSQRRRRREVLEEEEWL